MPPRRRSLFRFIAPIVLLLAIAALLLRFRLWQLAEEISKPLEPTPAPPSAAQLASEAAPTPTATPRADLPSLDQSDPWIRKLAAALSSHPKLAAWLVNDRLVHRFVAAVDNVAEGKRPNPHVTFLAPTTRFRVTESGGRVYADPGTFERNQAVVDVLTSLDPKGSAELYQAAKPLIDEEYRHLGYPDRKFDETLARAIDNLLRTPIPPPDAELKLKVNSYRYADPKLEALSPAQKQLLRLGPDNARKVQAKLRELAETLGLHLTA
jgi:hypothetical protein